MRATQLALIAAAHCVMVLQAAEVMCFDTPLSWTSAESACVARRGHLATVRNEMENTDLASTHACWIGCSSSSGSWGWASGEPFSFTRWGLNEPSGDGLCCELMANAQWNDLSCDRSLPFCCECPSGFAWDTQTEECAWVPATATTTVTTATTEGPRQAVSPGDEVEVRCARGGNAGFHPARVHNVSSSSIVVAYEHLGHLYFCAPKQWRMASGLQGESCAEHGGILPEWGGHKCCPASCGVCGAPDCHSMPGGKGDCCTRRIPDNKACGVDGNRAPCSIVPRLPADPTPSQRRLRGPDVAEENLAKAPFWVKDAADVQIVA